jgi:hypothetical protein
MTHPLFAIVAAAGISLAMDAPVSPGGYPQTAGLVDADFGRATPMQAQAPAAPSISSEVMILHATNDNTGIDPRIGNIPALSKPPFSSYNSYKLLDRTTTPLKRGEASPLKLPTGRELRLVYEDVIQPQKQGDSPRYVISASIEAASGQSFLPLVKVNAKPGEVFWVGGQEYKGGSLFIGIKVSP